MKLFCEHEAKYIQKQTGILTTFRINEKYTRFSSDYMIRHIVNSNFLVDQSKTSSTYQYWRL
jgi:hypothetical protein